MSENDVVIRAEGLGKKYLIGHQAAPERYASLRDTIAQTARGFLRSASDMARGRQIIAGDEVEEFWALKDVSFEIRRGEVVGVIGRNGAGKSTLLKVLSRITEPTEGRVTIRGRVASLLEVGTGFHPELSGRENIYLNGAILGMSRAEIRRKFDEIVDFAGVEKFLDTPVKRYSSGMYVRLAFSVAAHLEPEILIVDEVLAVGDAEFQKKCLGKMGEVAGHGRTVIFVSHNMPAVNALCRDAYVLKNGALEFYGSAREAIELHLKDRKKHSEISGKHIDVTASALPEALNNSGAYSLQFNIALRGPLNNPTIGLGINDSSGQRIATIQTETSKQLPALREHETARLRLKTEALRLAPGTYWTKVALGERGQDIEIYEDAVAISIPHYDPFDRKSTKWPTGNIFVKCEIAE